MKRILINATQMEEVRVAMVDGQLLYDLDIETPSREQKKSNIYKGRIVRIEPSLEAAFVDYGAERHGFLPFKSISKANFVDGYQSDGSEPSIKDVIKVDQEIIVQVEKEERSNKGAALSSFISLAGRFLVAMPQNPKTGGISRRVEGESREELKKIVATLNSPEHMGVIVRTAGVGRSAEEIQWDLDYLNQIWVAIEQAASEGTAPFLIYQESDIVVRVLRDHYKKDIGEIIIDSDKAYQQAHDFLSMVMPDSLRKLKKFKDHLPLFNRFQIESQIESAFSREVTLPSGGAIVIDHTEALTSIDINSARATKGGDIEETAKNTNLEAADEIARQLRIRDLGGLIVIDFIDMSQARNQREVETRLRHAVYEDRARVQISRISGFGLLEMSRQRLRPSLGESSQIVCPRCNGQGAIRDAESLSLAVLRLLEEESLKDNTGKILAKIPVECATYLLNEKRDKVESIEKRQQVRLVIIPDPNLETPYYSIVRVKDSDSHRHESNYKKSYEMVTEESPVNLVEASSRQPFGSEVAAVRPFSRQPLAPAAGMGGFLARLWKTLWGGSEQSSAGEKEQQNTPSSSAYSDRGASRGRRSNGRNHSRQRNSQNRNQHNRENTSADETRTVRNQPANQPQKDGGKPQTSSGSPRSRGSRSGNRNNRSRSRNQHSRDNSDGSVASSVTENRKTVETSGSEPRNTQNIPAAKKPHSPVQSAASHSMSDAPVDS